MTTVRSAFAAGSSAAFGSGCAHFLLFLTRLLYRDMSVTVERAPLSQDLRTRHDHYDAIFRFQHGRLADATGPT